jgi:hypothetical protein
MVIFFVCASFLWIKYNQAVQNYEKRLTFNENMLLWYFENIKRVPKAKRRELNAQTTSLKLTVQTKKQRSEQRT